MKEGEKETVPEGGQNDIGQSQPALASSSSSSLWSPVPRTWRARQVDPRKIPRRDLKLLVGLFRNHGLGPRSLPLAVHLLAQTGNLGALITTSPERLRQLGVLNSELAILATVGETISVILRQRMEDRPLISNLSAVIDYVHADMAYLQHEVFRFLFLNTRNYLIHEEKMFRGTVNKAPAYPRDIVLRALELGSTSLIIVHNHPSGDPKPSRDDIAFTRGLVQACSTMDIIVHDHLIVGLTGHTSLRAMGYL